jgi:hypothetical protein
MGFAHGTESSEHSRRNQFGARAHCPRNAQWHLPTAEGEIESGAAHRSVRVCQAIKTLTQRG